ncbi:MAG: hypothetical protein ABGZ17_07680 [Planctomycetaceae bacterium]
MLVISRKKDECIVLFDKELGKLVGFILVQDAVRLVKLGLDLDQKIGVLRLELTGWASLTFSELRKIPTGTEVPLLQGKMKNAGGVRSAKETAVHHG